MTTVPASNRPHRGCTTRRLFAAWVAGAFLLLGLPVTVSVATASPATPQSQLHRAYGLADTPGLRVERQTAPRLVRPVEHLRLLPWPSDLGTHAAVLPTTHAPALHDVGLAVPTHVPSADSVPTAAARGRGPPVPVIPSAGTDAFLGRPDVSGALGDPTA